MSDTDLSGSWIGVYNYPSHYPPTRFQATLRDQDGALSGETVEQEETFARTTLRALIEGRRTGESVSFVKFYEDEAFNSEFVRYEGRIASGGDEIGGRWEVPGHWSGTFLMVREGGAEEEVERRAVVEVDRD